MRSRRNGVPDGGWVKLRYVALAAALAACGGAGSAGNDLRFSTLSDAELSRLATAALGLDVVGTEGSLTSFDASDPCPQRTIDSAANTLTVKGDCTRANGVMVLGRGVVTNPPEIIDGLTYDATASTIDELEGFGLHGDSIDVRYNGRIETTPQADVTFVLDATLLGLTVHSDLHEPACGASCEITGTISYEAAGVAIVTGTTLGGADHEGHVTAVGADTLKIDWIDRCTWELVDAGRSGVCN